MDERDPELERLLSAEKHPPPTPPAELSQRLWQRVRASVEPAPAPTSRLPRAGALVGALLVGAGLGALVMKLSAAPVSASTTVTTTSPAPAQATQASPPSPAAPIVEPSSTPTPPPTRAPAFDTSRSRDELRAAILDNELAKATQLIDEHRRQAPADDLDEERDALLLRVAVFSQAPDARRRLDEFQKRYPESLLVEVLPTGPDASVATGGKDRCTLSGTLEFTTPDRSVRRTDVVVFIVDSTRRKGQEPPPPRTHEVLIGPEGFSPRALIAQRGDTVSVINTTDRRHTLFGARGWVGPQERRRTTLTKEGGLPLLGDDGDVRGWVMVVPNRALATHPAEDGTWSIALPRGPHVVRAMEPNGALLETRIADCNGETPVPLNVEGAGARPP